MSRTNAAYSGSALAAVRKALASSPDQGRIVPRCHCGSSTSRATLRTISSSRTARVSAELSTVRMIWTLRTESPASRRLSRKRWTLTTDRLGERAAAQAGRQVEADDHLVEVVGCRAPVALHEVLKPVLQVRAEAPRFVWHRDAGARLLLRLSELVAGLVFKVLP